MCDTLLRDLFDMKKYILSLFFALVASFAQADEPEYTFTTQNGNGKWVTGASSPTADFDRGRYDNMSFTLDPDSLYAPTPYDSKGSLTQASAYDGSALTPEGLTGADYYFQDGHTVSLTQIELKGEARNGSSFVAGTYMRITDSTGNTYTSNEAALSINVSVGDPWAPGWFFSDDLATFTFADTVLLEIGVQYTVQFVDASGNLLTGNNRPYMELTGSGGEGFSAGGISTLSPAGLKIITQSIVPEPSTAVMGLLAVFGFAARRRRKQ